MKNKQTKCSFKFLPYGLDEYVQRKLSQRRSCLSSGCLKLKWSIVVIQFYSSYSDFKVVELFLSPSIPTDAACFFIRLSVAVQCVWTSLYSSLTLVVLGVDSLPVDSQKRAIARTKNEAQIACKCSSLSSFTSPCGLHWSVLLSAARPDRFSVKLFQTNNAWKLSSEDSFQIQTVRVGALDVWVEGWVS